MALKLSGSISLTGSLTTDSSIVATVVTSSFFTGSYLDSLGNSGSADQILISDGRGGSVYKEVILNENTSTRPASANKFSISWQDNLNFTASATSVYIPGEDTPRSQLGEKNITLAPADSTHPRFDVFIFSGSATDTSSGSIEVVQGTASENPVYPDIILNNEVPLKFVLIKAGAVVPSDGSDENNTDGADFVGSSVFSDNANDGNSWKSFGTTETSANISLPTIAMYGSKYYDQFDYGDTTYGNAMKWPREGIFEQTATVGFKDRFGFWHPDYNSEGSGLTLGTLDALEFDLKMPSSVTGSYFWTEYVAQGKQTAEFVIYLIEARSRNYGGALRSTVPAAAAIVHFKDYVDFSRDDFQKVSIPASNFEKLYNGGANSKIIFIHTIFKKAQQHQAPYAGVGNGMYIRNIRWVDGSGATVELDPTDETVSNSSANTLTTINNGQFTGSFTGSFHGSYLDSLGNTGSADEILISDGTGNSSYKTVVFEENTAVRPASANKFSISWQDNLNFTASATSVYIPGEETPRSQLGEKNITLAAADSTHPRFDVFIFSGSATDLSSGSVEVVQGTASENPIYPDINLDNEVPLKFILLKAGASVPSDGSDENNTDGADFVGSSLFSDNADDGNSWKSFGTSNTSANIDSRVGNMQTTNFDQFDYADTTYGNAMKWPRVGSFEQDASQQKGDKFGFWHPNYNVEDSGLTLGTLDALEFELKMPTSATGSVWWTEYVKKGMQTANFQIYFHKIYNRYTNGTPRQTTAVAQARVTFKDFVDVTRDDFQKISIPANNFQGMDSGGAGSKIIFIHVILNKNYQTGGPLAPAGDGIYIRNLRWVDGSGAAPTPQPTGKTISQGSAAIPAALSGKQNTLSSTAVSSVVVSGENNRVTTKRSFIGAGRYNLIAGNTDSVIGGGSFNSSSNACTFIGGGSNNILTGSAVSSSILGGFNNSSSLANTHIIGSNITADKANYTYVNNLSIEGVVSGSTFSGSFVGDGSGLTGISGGGGADSDWYDGTTYISSSVGIQVTGSIGGTTKLTIGSGHTNSGTLASIAGGETNCINTGAHCTFIGGGRNNSLSGTYGVIVGGVVNCLQASFSSILGGAGNCIATSANHNSVIGGRKNCICGTLGNNSNCNLIGGGECNIITQSTCHTSIVNGCHNTGSADFGAILGGSNNNLQHNCSFIIGDNITSDKACYTFMNNLDVAGTVSGSTFSGSFVGDGSGLTGISGGGGGDYSPFITGSNPYAIIPVLSDAATSIGAYSTIAGGRHNEIRTTSTNSFIGAGCKNCLSSGMSFIGAGCQNTGSAACLFIGAGIKNFNYGLAAGIVAGSCNEICNLAYYGFIGAGQCNDLVGGTQHSAIVGGCNNVLNDNTDGGIIGAGKSNTISNGACCSGILGGVSNTVDHDKAFIIGSNLTTTATCYTFVNNLCNVGGGTSDCRLKENIVNIPYGLTHISQLNPVSFNFKDDESKKIKYGFLAQCVQEVMPDLVYHHPTDLVDGDPVLQFDREAIWASTINAIKDLKQQVEVLKAEIEILKQQ